VNVTVGEVNADVRERLQPYQAVQGEHQAPYRFMLFAQQELVMSFLAKVQTILGISPKSNNSWR